MADPRFFHRAGPFGLGELAGIGGAALAEGVDPARQVSDVAPLDRAGADDITWVDNAAYLRQLPDSKAGVCILRPEHARRAPEGMALLLSPAPYRSLARIAQAFYPAPAPVAGTHASAVVDPAAAIDTSCQIGPGVVIAAGAEIGPRCVIGANTTIGHGVVLGADCRIAANVTLSHALVGARVTVHPGARIGQDGFDFAPDPAGHLKVPQVGRVVIEDDCDIGANTTIDRGSVQDTVIGPGCWIDNLVQIGHNVRLGRGCIIVAQVGISGSTQLGNFVVVGGQAAMTGHLKIGDGAEIAAKSGVMRDVPAGGRVGGIPAMPLKELFRILAAQRRAAKKEAGGGDDGG